MLNEHGQRATMLLPQDKMWNPNKSHNRKTISGMLRVLHTKRYRDMLRSVTCPVIV